VVILGGWVFLMSEVPLYTHSHIGTRRSDDGQEGADGPQSDLHLNCPLDPLYHRDDLVDRPRAMGYLAHKTTPLPLDYRTAR